MKSWIVLPLTLLFLAAGCLGLGGDGESDEGEEVRETRARVDITRETTAIQGVVTDTAVQPIEGAAVSIVETGDNTTTLADGSWAIGPLDPGIYTVTVRAEGFVSSEQTTEAPAGARAEVDFLLTPLVSEQPFTQQFEVAGFFEYGWGLGLNLTGNTSAIRDSNCDYDQIAGSNCRGSFDLEPPLKTIIFEMSWTPSSPIGDELLAMLRVRDNAAVIDGTWEFFSIEGPSPLYHRMDQNDLDAVVEGFQARCEDGEDQFCSLGFRDQGWPLQTRVWPGWRCPTGQLGFCAVLQQDYTQYLTAFYNAPAPEGYSLVAGSTG